MKDVLLNDAAITDEEEDIKHLDTIDHANCVYGDRPLTIDVADLLSEDLKTKVTVTLKTCKKEYPTDLGCSCKQIRAITEDCRRLSTRGC